MKKKFSELFNRSHAFRFVVVIAGSILGGLVIAAITLLVNYSSVAGIVVALILLLSAIWLATK